MDGAVYIWPDLVPKVIAMSRQRQDFFEQVYLLRSYLLCAQQSGLRICSISLKPRSRLGSREPHSEKSKETTSLVSAADILHAGHRYQSAMTDRVDASPSGASSESVGMPKLKCRTFRFRAKQNPPTSTIPNLNSLTRPQSMPDPP
jgi:hypothetical protein